MTKININQDKGEEAVNNLIELTSGKETQHEKNERIRQEVLRSMGE